MVYEEQEKPKNIKEQILSFFGDIKILAGHSLYVLNVTCRCILHGINTQDFKSLVKSKTQSVFSHYLKNSYVFLVLEELLILLILILIQI